MERESESEREQEHNEWEETGRARADGGSCDCEMIEAAINRRMEWKELKTTMDEAEAIEQAKEMGD